MAAALYFFNLSYAANNAIVDIIGHFTPDPLPLESRSLVIEATPEEGRLPTAFWVDLAQQLYHNGARQIHFLFLPGEGKNLQLFDTQKNIFIGLLSSSKNNRKLLNVHTKPQEPHASFHLAAIDTPPPIGGVYRKQNTVIQTSQFQATPHLVKLGIEELTHTKLPPLSQYTVNFTGKSIDHQPRISLEKLRDGNLVQPLIAGRTVFIGVQMDSPYYGLHIPTSSGTQRISLTQFTAHSYDCLLHRKNLQTTGPLVSMLLFFIFTILGWTLTQYLRPVYALLTTSALSVATLATGWLCLNYLTLQLPFFEILTCQFLTTILVLGGKSVKASGQIDSMVLNTRREVQARLQPASIYDSPHYWRQISGMVSQVLNLERSIFLEKIPGDHRVEEVSAVNTSIEDIIERRRDFERTPYSTALAANGAIEVQDYLTERENELQFLTPLQMGEKEVLGFWACSVSRSKLGSLRELLSQINTFSGQISELLYARQRRQFEKRQDQNLLRRLLRLEGGAIRTTEINASFSLLIKRLNTVETVFDSIGMGAILYDLFGQVVYANKRLNSLFQELDLSPYKYSGAELINQLTEQPLDEVRSSLSNLIFTGEKVHYNTKRLGKQQEIFQIRISPVTVDEDAVVESEQHSPHVFNVLGLLLEIHEMSDMERILRAKDTFFKMNERTFHSYEISFPPILEKLQDQNLKEEKRKQLIGYLSKRLSSLFDSIRQLGDLMTRNLLSPESSQVPTDFKDCLTYATKAIAEDAISWKIDFDVQSPEYLDPVLAVPEKLESVFRKLLRYLINDTEAGKKILIEFQKEQRYISCRMQSTGFGMPDSDFQKYLDEDEASLSTEFLEIHRARELIDQFNGIFSGSSELGKGTEFFIKLRKFK